MYLERDAANVAAWFTARGLEELDRRSRTGLSGG